MYKKILVAIDDSETSRCALKEALHIAKCSDAKLYISHVTDDSLLNVHGHVFAHMAESEAARAITTLSEAGATKNVTSAKAPAASETRANPQRIGFGVACGDCSARTYTCTTSSVATLPMFCTLARTLRPPSGVFSTLAASTRTSP